MTNIAHSLVGYKPEGRPENDFYPTPIEAVEKLLWVEQFMRDIWEPACGDGAISKYLEARGHNVVSTDIYCRYELGEDGDFLCLNIKDRDIITNPPFKLANQFIERAYDLRVRKFAFLLKLVALEGAERSALLEKTGLTRVWVFRKRLTITRNGIKMKNSGMIAFAWFVWERDNKNYPKIGWI